MKKILCMLFLAAAVLLPAAVSCSKTFETEVELGMEQDKLNLPSFEAGYFYVHIYSSTSWKIQVEDESWLHCEKTSGKGSAYPKFTYDENTADVDRETYITVSSKKKTCRVLVVQPKSV